MVSESTPPRRPILTFDNVAQPLTRRPERLHALTSADLAIAFSQALDLAEGKMAGHAQRVCYIAAAIAERLDIEGPERSAVFFGALLHDIGVTASSAELCRIAGMDEAAIFGPSPLKGPDDQRAELVFADRTAIAEAVHQHCTLGAETVLALDLPEEAANVVASHHESWDGSGFPEAIEGTDIPLAARIIAVADVAEVAVGDEMNALVARRHFGTSIGQFAGTRLDPTLVKVVLDLARSDQFWLGLHADDLTETLALLGPPVDTRKSRRRVMRFAEVFADLADAKGAHTAGHSRRTSEAAERLAGAIGLDGGHTEMIRIAALLHDVGLLGVPARVMSKPDILSVTEMQLMRQHPGSSELILQELAGFEEIALWIARHHERPDGKGYPEMLAGDEIPLESRLLAVADVYAALIAERPHRGAMGSDDAKQVLLGAAGTQLDPELVRTFVSLI